MVRGGAWGQNSFGNRALVTQGGPEIDWDGLRDPFGTQVVSRTATGRRASLGGPAFLDLLGRPWALQGLILDPRGEPKMVQNRHGEARSAPWGAKKGQKALPKGVPKWGRTSERKGYQIESILGTPLGFKMGPWSAQVRPRRAKKAGPPS